MSLLSRSIRELLPWNLQRKDEAPRRPGKSPTTVDVRGCELCLPHADITAEYEPQVLDYIDRLPGGSRFFDLGACVGFFSLYASNRGLDVYALEIESKNFAALTANLAANPTMPVHALHMGVSDGSSDWADLRIGQDCAGGHHKTLVCEEFAGPANIARDDYRIERVRVAALDALCDSGELPMPEHMKIDIDGSEVLFLRGAPRTLSNPVIRSLMFELYEDSPYYAGVVDRLSDCGFRLTAKHPIEQPWPGCERLFNCEFWK